LIDGEMRAPRGNHDVLIALGLSIGAMVGLGFSRFAYALLLPPMREALGWSFTQAGGLNAANGFGYIFGSLAVAWAAKRWGPARPFQIGLLVSAIALLLTAATSNFATLFALRFVGGLSTAFAFILGAALAGAIDVNRGSRRGAFLIGIFVAGAGFGIVVSGVVAPTVLATGAGAWRAGWIALGALALVGAIPAWLAAGAVRLAESGAPAMLAPAELRQLAPTIVAYSLFGAGYVGYMTFVIALLRSQGSESGDVTAFWIVLGVASTVSTLFWGDALGQFAGGKGAALVFAIAAIGALPILISPSLPAAFLSALVFGGGFMAGPAAVTIIARQQLPAASLTAGVAVLTVAFSLFQALGPLLSGAITDVTKSVAAGLWTSPALLGLAAASALLQRPAR
jgi:predicted MFS family arabinose efflux permease